VNQATHAFTRNGRIHTEVSDTRFESPRQIIGHRLSLLDGTALYSLSVWRLPEGVSFDKVNLRKWPQEYMQVAGSRERMTLEFRRFEDGLARQYVVGRPPNGSEAEVVIPWDGYEARVFANEVFDSDEATELFTEYYFTGGVSETYHLRLLAF